jgi:hypothetical protein
MQSDELFKYLSKFNFIFETNLGYESGDQMGVVDEQNRSKKSRASLLLKV